MRGFGDDMRGEAAAKWYNVHPLSKARGATQGCWWLKVWPKQASLAAGKDGLEEEGVRLERKTSYITTLSRWGKEISSDGQGTRWQRQEYKNPSRFLTGIPRQRGRLISGGDHGYQVPATVQVKAGERGKGKERWWIRTFITDLE